MKKHNRVLIVQGELPHYRLPFFHRLGGKPGLELTVAHSGADADSADLNFIQQRLKVVQLPKGFRYYSALPELVMEFECIVMMFDLHWINVYDLLVRRPKSLVYWGHGFGKRRIVRRPRVEIAKRADATVFYGETGANEFITLGLPQEKAFVAGNTVEVPVPGRDAQSARTEFLFVGSLRRRKAVGDLLDAFASVSAVLPVTVGITVIGKGDEYNLLRTKARTLAIDHRVTFKGWIHDESVLREEFSRAIAYVSPRHVGLGALHSFAYGVPVVTIPTEGLSPEIENIVHDENGLLYDGSISGLAECLVLLAKDESKAQYLGENAYQHYSIRRTPELMANGMHDAIMYAIEGSDRHTRRDRA